MTKVVTLQTEMRESMTKYFANPTLKEWNGADVQVAFDEHGVFKRDNWNDRRMHLFRLWFDGLSSDSVRNDFVCVGNLTIAHLWEDDQNYVTIQNDLTKDCYEITWYKERGRTDNFQLNHKPITLTQFKDLLTEMLKPEKEI
jgi:hypothetical protein